ncbi:hypothetical protein ACUHMQ_04445 [Chitinimonas sp. PSY-7]|uniref:hypothetical protein n=1 Tax=Chitinimonas sp. PSY-7 TaxID=3459088 RepID=UPI00404003E1
MLLESIQKEDVELTIVLYTKEFAASRNQKILARVRCFIPIHGCLQGGVNRPFVVTLYEGTPARWDQVQYGLFVALVNYRKNGQY